MFCLYISWLCVILAVTAGLSYADTSTEFQIAQTYRLYTDSLNYNTIDTLPQINDIDGHDNTNTTIHIHETILEETCTNVHALLLYNFSMEQLEQLAHFLRESVDTSSKSYNLSNCLFNLLEAMSSKDITPSMTFSIEVLYLLEYSQHVLDSDISSLLEKLFYLVIKDKVCGDTINLHATYFQLNFKRDCGIPTLLHPTFIIPHELQLSLSTLPYVDTYILIQNPTTEKGETRVTLKYYSFAGEVPVHDLEQPIQITIPLVDPSLPISCRYLNTSTNQWQTDGCELLRVVGKYAVCGCTHLTEFAIHNEANMETQVDVASVESDDVDTSLTPNGLSIEDMKTLVIGVSITGTVILVVILTAVFICCSSKILKERAVRTGQGMDKKATKAPVANVTIEMDSVKSTTDSLPGQVSEEVDKWNSVIVTDPWAEADKHVLMADWEGNLSLEPYKSSRKKGGGSSLLGENKPYIPNLYANKKLSRSVRIPTMAHITENVNSDVDRKWSKFSLQDSPKSNQDSPKSNPSDSPHRPDSSGSRQHDSKESVATQGDVKLSGMSSLGLARTAGVSVAQSYLASFDEIQSELNSFIQSSASEKNSIPELRHADEVAPL